MNWILSLSLLIFFELVADIFSKKWSLTGYYVFWLLAISGYILANIFWLKAIRSGSGLARGALIFSVASAVAALVIGAVFYKENIAKLELGGMILGIVSIILILWN